MIDLRVKNLKAEAKKRGINGRSKMWKADLLAALFSAVELKAIARELKIKGRSKLRKAELAKAIAKCRTQPTISHPVAQPLLDVEQMIHMNLATMPCDERENKAMHRIFSGTATQAHNTIIHNRRLRAIADLRYRAGTDVEQDTWRNLYMAEANPS